MHFELEPIRLLLADDHELYRDGFNLLLRKQSRIVMVGQASDGYELIRKARSLKPDVIVTDIKMPGLDGMAATAQLVREMPWVPIIALSMSDEEDYIKEMTDAGAKGYLLKNASKQEILEAVETVLKGGNYYCHQTTRRLAAMLCRNSGVKLPPKVAFNDKEAEVIRHICEGKSNKDIATVMNMSVRTIEGYRERIQEKMEVKNAAGVVVYAIKHKLFAV